MTGYDVAVVGGGPVGMWLAAELHRGGVRPVVLEQRAERPRHSKALTIYPRTMEQFAMRGLVDRWLAEGTPVPSSHFALLKNRLEFSFLDTRYPYTLFLPQRRTEELLQDHVVVGPVSSSGVMSRRWGRRGGGRRRGRGPLRRFRPVSRS